MNKAVPVLSVLLATAVGGVIFFFVKKSDLDKKVAELNDTMASLHNDLNSLSEEKGDLTLAKEKVFEKLKHSQSEHEKTLAKLKVEKEKQKALAEERDKMMNDLKEEIDDQRVKISELNGVIKVKMDNKILFPSGQAEISKDGKSLLERVASSLNRLKGKRIRIEGHTDNVPIHNSSFKSNWELACTRAVNVLHVLIDNSTVKPILYEAVGMGEFHPVAPNDTPENRALNRRIEILLIPIIK